MSERELKDEIILDKGLLPTENSAKNNPYLVQCDGAFPFQGVLQTVDNDPSIIDPLLSGVGALLADGNSGNADGSILADGGASTVMGFFPFPQVFITINAIIVCLSNKIIEIQNGLPVVMIDGIVPGLTWEVVDFQEWVYFTNGRVAIVKDQDSSYYRYAPELPFGTGALNFNGQLIILSPNAVAPSSLIGS